SPASCECALPARLLLHAPHLEALGLDRLFDHGARDVMRRRAGRSYDAGHGPRPVLLRQPCARRIARKGLQLFSRFGFEDVEAHGNPPFCETIRFCEISKMIPHMIDQASNAPATPIESTTQIA